MKYLFQTVVLINGIEVRYKIYLHTNGSHYAESMNPDFDNFMLKNKGGVWNTSLAHNRDAAGQIGSVIEAKHLV